MHVILLLGAALAGVIGALGLLAPNGGMQETVSAVLLLMAGVLASGAAVVDALRRVEQRIEETDRRWPQRLSTLETRVIERLTGRTRED